MPARANTGVPPGHTDGGAHPGLDSKGKALFASVDIVEPFDGRRSTTLRPDSHDERETVLFVRRADAAALVAESRVSWVPAALPLRKECYTLQRDQEGVVSVVVPPTTEPCRLTTSVAQSTLSLW